MNIEGKVILIRRFKSGIMPRFFSTDNFNKNRKDLLESDLFIPTKEELNLILESLDIDPSNYSNPLEFKKEIPKKKRKKVKDSDEIVQAEQITVEQDKVEE